MKLRVLIAAVIFVGSYLPLSLILLAENFDYSYLGRPLCWNWWAADTRCALPIKNAAFSIGIFVVCLVCFAATLITLAVVKGKREIVIHKVKHVPAELMNYVLPYIVSFMNIDYQVTGKFVGFVIFLGWMFWITYKSGQIILNPLLIAFGWRLYDVTYNFAGDSQEFSSVLLASAPILPNERYRQVEIQAVLVIKK